MLRIICDIVKWLLLGILATILLLLFFVFFLSIPELLDIMSSYIGDVFTWVIFIFIIVGIIVLSVNSGK